MVHYLLDTTSLRNRRIKGWKSGENREREPSLSFPRFSQPLPLVVLPRLRYHQKKTLFIAFSHNTSINTIGIRETTICTACVCSCTVGILFTFQDRFRSKFEQKVQKVSQKTYSQHINFLSTI